MGDLVDDARSGEEIANLLEAPLATTEEVLQGTDAGAPVDPAAITLPDGTTSDVMKEASLSGVHTVKDEDSFMDEEEQALADEFYEAMMTASRTSPRAQQQGRFVLGVSDLGFCPERTKRMLSGEVPEPTDVLPAFLGTAIGDHAEKAYAAAHPDVITQADVEVTFTIRVGLEKWTIKVPGHPDIIDPANLRMIDVKTDFLLADAERQGADQQKRFQRHCYGLGAWQAGYFPDGTNIEDVKVGNVWIDRSAKDRRVHVELEPLDLGVIRAAEEWLEDVVYAMVNDEPAEKAPPREMCLAVCGYAGDCRGLDTDTTGLLTDELALARIEMYREGADQEKAGKRLKEAARAALEEMGKLSGNTPNGFQVRWSYVNGGWVPEHHRQGYTKLDIRPIPKGRKK